MFNTWATVELQKLNTEELSHSKLNKQNPIGVGTATKHLAAAHAEMNCILEDVGVHGRAWMAELEEFWLKCPGISGRISPPKKLVKGKHLDVWAGLDCMGELQAFTLHSHLSCFMRLQDVSCQAELLVGQRCTKIQLMNRAL